MKYQWLGSLLLLIIVNLLVKPLWIFGIDRYVQNIAGTTQYGLYFATFNFTVVLYTLLDMGMANYNARNIAQNPKLLPVYLPKMMLLKAILSVLYVTVCMLGAWYLAYTALQWQLLFYLAINQICITYISYFRSNLQGLHHFRTDTFLSILDRLLAIFLCGGILWGVLMPAYTLNVLLFAQAQTISYLFTALVGYLSNRRIVLSQAEASKHIVRLDMATQPALVSILLQIISETLPYALMVLLMSIYMRLDAILLEALLPDGAQQAGIYASAYRILDALNMIGALAATQLLPHFARYPQHSAQLNAILKITTTTALVGSVLVGIICWTNQQYIMQWLYTGANAYYAQVFAWLMWAILPIAMTYIYGTLFTARGNMRLVNTIVLIGMLTNVSLNLYLIPNYKALGAAWAALGSQSIIALGFLAAFVFHKPK